MSEPTVRPTTWSTLALGASVGVAAAVVARLVLEPMLGGVPAPYGTAVVLLLLGLVLAAMARTAHVRIQQRREPVEPRQAVAWLAAGKASAVAGAFCVGLFGTWLTVSLPRWATQLGRDRSIHSGLAVVAALGVVAAGLVLERSCRVPPTDDDTSDHDEFGAPPAHRP